MSVIKKKNLSISRLLKESASILEQTNRSYGSLKLGLFVTKSDLLYNFSEYLLENTPKYKRRCFCVVIKTFSIIFQVSVDRFLQFFKVFIDM